MQRPRVSVFQICIHSFSYLLITLSAGHPLAAHGTDVINSYLIRGSSSQFEAPRV